jgi:uncharacterized protein YdaU (DUF1376 family)
MNRPWMPLYIADYIKDTSHLRALESGAYLHLIMAYWVSGRLPNDDRQLATIAKLTDREWRGCKAVLAEFFGPDWSSHKRIDKELAETVKRGEVLSEKARNAANKRWSKHAASMPQASPEQSPSNAPQCTLHTSHNTKKESEDISAVAIATCATDWPSDYREVFWEAYPRKVGKKGALRELDRHRKSVSFEKLISAVRAYAATADPQFTKHPKTWLHNGCWDDEPDTRKPHGSTAPNGLASALDKLKQHVGEIERSEEGGYPPPRLLSHG